MSSILVGVYVLKCLKTNRRYVGSSINIKSRLKDHKTRIRNNVHENKELNGSDVKFITEEILELCPKDSTRAYLFDREQYYIDELKPEFNKWKKARGPDCGETSPAYGKSPWCKGLPKEQQPMFGRKHSEKTRAEMSAKKTGPNNNRFGIKCSVESNLKRSMAILMRNTHYWGA